MTLSINGDHTQFLFTVFTPSYNRAATLPMVFRSLQRQTLKAIKGAPAFEWVVVDDGSTDNTREVMAALMAAAVFPIRYIYKHNSGKHVAMNRAVEQARGALFITADSDDWFVSYTLERFAHYWEQLTDKQKRDCFGITCLCWDGNADRLIGRWQPVRGFELVDGIYFKYKHRLYFERWGFVRTDILKRFPFPEQNDLRFIPEGLVWNRISRHYRQLIVNDVLRVVYFRQDGLSANIRKSYLKDSEAHFRYHCESLQHDSRIIAKYDPIRFIKKILQVNRFADHTGRTLSQRLRLFNQPYIKFLLIVTYPMSYLLYLDDFLKFGRSNVANK